jgi:hypothetical protein
MRAGDDEILKRIKDGSGKPKSTATSGITNNANKYWTFTKREGVHKHTTK